MARQASSPAETAAARIVNRLKSDGYEAYFVGGCVRDMVLNREPADFDVVTNAHPSEITGLFDKTFSIGAQFGVILVATQIPTRVATQAVTQLTTRPGEADGSREILTEVATYRSDCGYSDGRRPDAVRFAQSAQEDVQRRDFTINGLLLDPDALSRGLSPIQAVVDYVGGLADLDAGILRAIGNPAERFAEDKLRMLRAVRFAARFRFTLDPATSAGISQFARDIRQVSPERARDELTRMLTEGQARRAFELLDATGLLREVLPEVDRMHGVEQPPNYHPEGDVWAHTLRLLEQLPEGCSATLAWGALLHDVGKPPTFERAPDRIRFSGHPEIGGRIAAAICRRFRFSNEDCAQVVALVENHMRFGDVKKMKDSTLKRFFRLPRFPEHLALHKMDCLAGFGALEFYEFARERFENLPVEQVRPKLLVTGRDLIATGYKPGPQFKKMLAMAEDAQLEGRIHSTEEGVALIRHEFPEASRQAR